MLPSARRAVELLHRREPALPAVDVVRSLLEQGWRADQLEGAEDVWAELIGAAAPSPSSDRGGLPSLPPLPESVRALAAAELRRAPDVDVSAPALAGTLRGMRDAVLAERDAVRAGRKDERMALGKGREAGRAGDRWVYRFRPLGTVRTSDGAWGRVRADGQWSDAEVVTARGAEITLAVPRRLRDLDAVELEVDAAFLLDRLAVRLVQSSAMSGRVSRGDRLQEPCAAPPRQQVEPVPLHNVLQGRQRQALAHAGRYERTYLWGPPGTGKTTTLASLIAGLVGAGRSVLVISTTNAAVDVAALRAVQRLEEVAPIAAGTCVRLGVPADPEGYAELSSSVLLADVVGSRGSSVVALRKDLLLRKDELVQQQRQLRRVVARPVELREELAKARDDERRAQAERRAAEVGLRNAEAYVRALRARRTPVRPADLAAAEGDVTVARQRLLRCPPVPERLVADEVRARLESAAADAERAERTLDAIAVTRAELEEQIEAVERGLDALRRAAVADARVLFATAHQSYLDEGAFLREFDHVIIDEASMMPLPLAWLAASRALAGVVIAGDFRQLPPIVTSADEVVQEWYAPDAFTRAAAEEATTRTGCCMVALEEQHRMQPAIRAIVAALSYPELALRDGEGVRAPTGLAFAGDAAVTLIDSSRLKPWVARAQGRSSRWNLLHAQVVSNVLAQALYAGDVASGDDIGIITPYSAQARLLSSAAEGVLGLEDSELASTVHRYQGAERDVIVLDMAAARGMQPHLHWFGANGCSEEGARLLNVALSRARHHLVVVADTAHLTGAGSYVQRLLAHLRRNATVLAADAVDHASAAVHVPARDMLTQLLADLDDAQSSIWLALAGGEASEVHAVVQVLLGAVRRGVVVRVVAGSGVDRAVEGLRAEGVVVDRRAPVQEDLCVIDETVVWGRGGSLLRRQGPAALRSISPVLGRRVLELSARRRLDGRAVGEREHTTRDCVRCGAALWRVERRWPSEECRSLVCSTPKQRSQDPRDEHDEVQSRREHLRRAGTIRMADFD